MKTTLILLLLLCACKVNAQISVYAGDSELKGLFGTEIQISRISISGGWRPAYASGWIHSFSTALTYYQPIGDFTFYLTSGITSKGYSYYIENLKVKSVPSLIAMAGTRFYLHEVEPKVSDRWIVDAGVGLNSVAGRRKLMTFEILLKYIIIK